ncbi:MAG: GAF domain-containing protein [Deinococcales bacterium]
MLDINFIRNVEQSSPAELFAICARFADALIGVKLFTLTSIHPQEGLARRIYSNMPQVYPVSGTKPMTESPWSEQVLKRGEIFVANDIESIAQVFPDHALIASLGCASVINIPIIFAKEVIGTVNCLHETAFYTPDRVALAAALKSAGLICFLAHRLQSKNLA